MLLTDGKIKPLSAINHEKDKIMWKRISRWHGYLVTAVVLVVVSLLIIKFDPDRQRSLSTASLLINLAGAYWIASGVVLRAADFSELAKTTVSSGMLYIGNDPIKQIIPEMLKTQSERAKFGLFLIALATSLQLSGSYLLPVYQKSPLEQASTQDQ